MSCLRVRCGFSCGKRNTFSYESKLKTSMLHYINDSGLIVSRDGRAALPRGATGLSGVCDCGIS